MIRLIQWLIWGHVHEWETMGKTTVFEGTEKKDGRLPRGTDYILKCKKCGDIKVRKHRS